MRSLAESLGIGDRVTFLGFQGDMVATYRWLDVVVHASTQPEPFGLVIAEAMACGKPVIVAQAGGAAELFTPGVDAIAVPANSPTDLAQSIRSLATHPGDRLRLGAAARQTALHRFGGDRLGQEVKRFYHHLKQNF